MPAKVHAIVVTYYPTEPTLVSLINKLIKQVDQVFIIDNGDPNNALVPNVVKSLSGKIHLIQLGSNLGIAKALNVGIKASIEAGSTHVVTMDQDSEIDEGMIYELLAGSTQLQLQGEKVAVIAPVYFDIHRNKFKKFQVLSSSLFLRSITGSDETCSEVLTVITSGCLYPIEAFERVGYFEEDLFIDHVDHEWCFRAWAKGMKVYCCWHARMRHELGDKFIKNKLTGRNVIIHNPVRNYYFFRNAVALVKRGYVPTAWKIFIIFNLLLKLIDIITFSSPRLTRLRLILKGLSDGIATKMGAFKG